MALKCERCFKNLVVCQDCKGRSGPGTGRTCKTCNSTGLVCPTDGKFWKK